MPLPLAKKLRIKDNSILRIINAPAGFLKDIGQLPVGTKITTIGKSFHQVHWFVTSKAQLENELSKILPLLTGEKICWIYYPKRTSKVQSDLTRDKGWDALLKHNNTLTWISLIAFNDTWSAFGLRPKTATDSKKIEQLKPRSILEYIDTKTKTVRLPDDLIAALRKNKNLFSFFNTLSFTNRKEYVEWIITAKRHETRVERIKGSIERLAKGWKNPRNL